MYRILLYKRPAQINASAQISAWSVAQHKEINAQYRINAQAFIQIQETDRGTCRLNTGDCEPQIRETD